LLSIVVVGAAAGCGGGRDALTKEQYVSKLNAMCEDFSAREKKIGEPQTLSDLVEKGPRIVDAFESAIVDKVHDLTPPNEIADDADRLVSLADRQRDVLSDLVVAAKDGDRASVQELVVKNATLNEQSNSIAGRLGAQACAGG